MRPSADLLGANYAYLAEPGSVLAPHPSPIISARTSLASSSPRTHRLPPTSSASRAQQCGPPAPRIMADKAAPLALAATAYGEQTGWRKGQELIDALPYVDALTPEEKQAVDRLIEEEVRTRSAGGGARTSLQLAARAGGRRPPFCLHRLERAPRRAGATNADAAQQQAAGRLPQGAAAGPRPRLCGALWGSGRQAERHLHLLRAAPRARKPAGLACSRPRIPLWARPPGHQPRPGHHT